MKPAPAKIQPMKLNIIKMRANNLNNFDLSNMPDDVYLNVKGDDSDKPKISLDSLQRGVDTLGAAANLAKGIKLRKVDDTCGKKPLITIGKAGKAKLRAYNDCIAKKGVVAAPVQTYVEPAPAPVIDDKIMGMPKPLFYGILTVLVLGGGLLAYKKFSK